MAGAWARAGGLALAVFGEPLQPEVASKAAASGAERTIVKYGWKETLIFSTLPQPLYCDHSGREIGVPSAMSASTGEMLLSQKSLGQR